MGDIALVAVLFALGFTVLPSTKWLLYEWTRQWYWSRGKQGHICCECVGMNAPDPVPEPMLPPARPPMVVPPQIIAYAESWLDPWVREDIVERAKRLYTEHQNWDIAFQELLKQDNEKV